MHSIHKLVTYTALILVSSLLFSVDVLADAEKKQVSAPSIANQKTEA